MRREQRTTTPNHAAVNNQRSKGAARRDGYRIREIERRLRIAYGQPRHFNPTDPLDDLIFLVLSRMTQEIKYVRTYSRLRNSLSTWHAVRDAPPDELEGLIHEAGLARTKTAQIQEILREIEAREVSLSLNRLREMGSSQIEAYLTSLPGVARKTALCVMLYALGRDVLPVDTHVWRVAQRLGLAPEGTWSEGRGRAFEAAVPSELRGSLHVTMVAHGRKVCRARAPICESCMLADLCPTADPNPRAAQHPPQSRPG